MFAVYVLTGMTQSKNAKKLVFSSSAATYGVPLVDVADAIRKNRGRLRSREWSSYRYGPGGYFGDDCDTEGGDGDCCDYAERQKCSARPGGSGLSLFYRASGRNVSL